MKALSAGLTAAEAKFVDGFVQQHHLPSMHVSERTPLAEYKTGAFGVLSFPVRGIEVRQVVGPKEMLMSGRGNVGQATGDFWVEGVSTKDVADGQALDLDNVVLEVAGTKQFTTILGAVRTVKRLKTFDRTNVDKVVLNPDVRRLIAQLTAK